VVVDTTHVYIEAFDVPEVNDSATINIDQIGLIVVANKLKPCAAIDVRTG